MYIPDKDALLLISTAEFKTLAEASQKPNNEEKQDLADTAITMLKGLISGLPTAATLYEACNKLLPLISKSLGLG